LNYLAHLCLSNRDPAIMVGNFIADNIPKAEEKLLPDDIMLGVLLHRKIDTFTDQHESFRKAVSKLRPHHRKYAPVVIDILNDHLLSLNWSKFYHEEETDFHIYAYQQLSNHVDRLPEKASRHIHALLEYQYLIAYSTKEGLEDILGRMDKRTRFPSDFLSAADHLYEDFDFYTDLFVVLYTDLVELINDT